MSKFEIPTALKSHGNPYRIWVSPESTNDGILPEENQELNSGELLTVRETGASAMYRLLCPPDACLQEKDVIWSLRIFHESTQLRLDRKTWPKILLSPLEPANRNEGSGGLPPPRPNSGVRLVLTSHPPRRLFFGAGVGTNKKEFSREDSF